MRTPPDWPRTPNGLPFSAEGETFGQYLHRLTDDEAATLMAAARFIGIQPRSLFISYVQTADPGMVLHD